MPERADVSTTAVAAVDHGSASSAAASAPAAATVQSSASPVKKMSRTAALRRQWSHRDMVKKKSSPAKLPSFSYAERRRLSGQISVAGAIGLHALAAPSTAATTTTSSSTTPTAPLMKRKSRASRATDAIARFFHNPRRSSDSSSKVDGTSAPAASDERRFWPRRLISEKKVTPTQPTGSVVAPSVGLHVATGDTSKSDAVRAPHHTDAPAAAPGRTAVATKRRSRVNPRATPSSQSSASRHYDGTNNNGSSRTHSPTAPRCRDNSASPSPRPASLEPPFAPQYTLDAFGAELTELEKTEVLEHGEIYFFSSLSVKVQRCNGKIQSTTRRSVGIASTSDANGSASALGAVPTSANESAQPAPAIATPPVELFNNGYDDERGDYLVLAHDHLAYRFEVLHALGSGSFGQVVCCLDHQTQQQVAVKIIRNRKKYREQSLIEVQILSQLHAATERTNRAHAGALARSSSARARIVAMHEYFLFRSHLCIVFELLGLNLYEHLKLRFFQGLELDTVRAIASQLVATLRVLETERVIHCDLKPENILIKPPSSSSSSSLGGSQRLVHATTAHAHMRVTDVCLIDFGSSCVESAAVFTYIQSRFYRSPEVILGVPYSTAIDMWSLGCILAELYTGYPLFAGESEADQLACIMEVLGLPSHAMLLQARRRRHFFTESTSDGEDAIGPRRSTGASASACVTTCSSDGSSTAAQLFFYAKPFVNSRGRKRLPGARSFSHALKTDDRRFAAFVRRCLALDPRERMTPEQAAQDPWLVAPSTSRAGDSSHRRHPSRDNNGDGDDASLRCPSISQSQEIVGI